MRRGENGLSVGYLLKDVKDGKLPTVYTISLLKRGDGLRN